ncbi:MAG: CHAT domain-containing tetratricopeptide repeat protein [Acidobacteriota bacterium]
MPRYGLSFLLALLAGLALGSTEGARIEGEKFDGIAAVRTWSGSETSHLYRFPLLAGQFVRIAAEQRSSDVILEILAPGEAAPTEIDGNTYATGTDAFELVAKASGEARVRVVVEEAIGEAPAYRLTISVPHPASARERLRAAAFAAFEEANALPSQQAVPLLERALRQAEDGRAGDLAAQIHDRIGRRLPEDDPQALRHFRAAAALVEEPQLRGAALHKLGKVLANLQRLDEAAAAYGAEYRLGRHSADPFREAFALEGLSNLEKLRGRYEEALARAQQALLLWRKLGDRHRQALSQQILGRLSLELGDPEETELRAKAGLALGLSPLPRADLLDDLALAYRYQEKWDLSLATSDQALAVARKLGDRGREASFLLTMGAVEMDRKRRKEALRFLRPAEAILRNEVDKPGLLANVEVILGVAATENGEVAEALERINRSLEGYRRLGRESDYAWVLSRRSDALRLAGRLDEARDDLLQAITILERLRPTLEPQRRANLLADRHRFFERLVDLLVEQKQFPAAFEASERSRARTLLDEVSGRPVAQARSLAEIQSSLPPGYRLLDYWLGETRSFVWVVRREGLSLAILPAQEAIEAQGRLASRALGAPPGRLATREDHVGSLARTLFGPIADRLAGQGFVVVPDGVLFKVPFAALPIPGSSGANPERLIDRGAVVTLPSASLALEIRDAVARRPKAQGLFAVGDPVFGCPDDRLSCATPKNPAPAPASLATRFGSWAETVISGPRKEGRGATVGLLPRIGRTGSEIAAIARLAGAGGLVERLGFAASRSAVLGAPLESFRVLHFATHGLVDPVRPARSGLALSRRDPRGGPLAGDSFLRLSDLAGRRLRADLVVLSACDTALGRETRGEGPQSLGRAFLAAGAAKALVSLWRVDDTSTEELMVGFYRQLLQRGLPAAAALRQSQLAVRSRPQWNDPYYWGAFVLQGDWRDDGL